MPTTPISAEESQRLQALRNLQLLDTPYEKAFDDLTFLAAQIMGTPTALISLIDADRQWFKSRHGLSITQTPRDIAFCAQTIREHEPLVVADALQDPRFQNNPLVTEAPHLRFYAGTRLVTSDGHAVGTLCAIDYVPRAVTAQQIQSLQRLADQVMLLLELRAVRLQSTVEKESLIRGERALEKSHQDFRAMVDAIKDYAIFTLDPGGHVATWNAGAERLVGYSEAQILGRHFSIFFTREDVALGIPEKRRQQLAEHKWLDDDGLRVRLDGSVFHANVVVAPRFDDAGRLEDSICIMHDVTRRKQEEEQLQRANDRYRMASAAAGLGFWDYDLVTGVLVWDDAMFRLYGRERAPDVQPYAAWVSGLHLDDRVRAEQDVAEAIAGRRPFDTTFRVVHPDGSVRHLRASANVARDSDGRAVRMYGVNVDVTEATETQDRLATSLRDRSALLQTLHEHALVSVADSKGRIVEVNDAFCRLSGYSRVELIGQDHRIVNSGKHGTDFWRGMWRQVCKGASWRAEVCNRARDGSLYWVDSIITRFQDPAGQDVKYVSIRFDITPLKNAQQRLLAETSLLESAEAVSGVGVIRVDLLSRKQAWSRQVFRIFEVPGETVPDSEILDALSGPETRRLLDSAMDNARKLGAGFELEVPMFTAAGRSIWIRTVGKVEFDNGKPARIIGVVQDVTLRRSADQKIKSVSERLQLAAGAAGMGIWEWDVSTDILHWDAQTFRIYGRDPENGELTFSHWITSLHEADREPTRAAFRGALEHLGKLETEFRIALPDGALRHLKVVAQVEVDPTGTSRRIVGLTLDITRSKAAETQLLEAARFDKLTGLANRSFFMECLDRAIARVNGGAQRNYAVLFLDFDRFKLVNDTLGHDAGDELLRQIARRLRGDLRASDSGSEDSTGNVVSRFGGDEFLLLLNDLSSPGDATRIAERLLNSLTPAYDILGNAVHSTASIGIFTSEHAASSAEDAVGHADAAMYEAKRAGRGCSVVFSEAMHTRIARHATIENSLRRALVDSEMSVVYQPIVELATGKMVSAEALLRWTHPELGDISPAEFIPIAEDSGLIVALDEWVLNQACEAMVAWRSHDPQGAPRTVSINLSRVELAQGQVFLDRLAGVIAQTGLPPECIQLEFAEREVMRNPAASRHLMGELRKMGVELAMDDFGTGATSLAFLRDFPFNVVKIDRSFVQGLNRNPDVLAVIHATLVLVENLNMCSLVEGIEDPTQLAVLQSLGCRFAQGYLFSRPVPAAQLPQALEMKLADNGNVRSPPSASTLALSSEGVP